MRADLGAEGESIEPALEDVLAPRIPGYDVVRALASSASAEVLLARQAASGREVAVKRWVAPARDPTTRARIAREVDLLKRVDHPGVVRLLDALADTAGRPCVVMEWVQGPTLGQRIRSQPDHRLPALAVVELALALVDAVAHLHARGVVHRDVKPDNVVLRLPDFRPVLVDLGIAKDLRAAAPLTREGAVLGTVHYMAPEQYGTTGSPVGPAADVYGIGATLYHAATGHWPLPAEARAVLEATAVPPGLSQVILACLRFFPDRRFPSADGALSAALRELERTLGPTRSACTVALAGVAAEPAASRSASSRLTTTAQARTPPPAAPTPSGAPGLPDDVRAALAEPQRRLGEWVVLGPLGKGGFGVVLAAWDPRHERRVAIKLLEKLDPRTRKRFEREVKALARLDHANVIPLLSSGEHQGRPFLVTPLVEGGSLEGRLPLPPDEAARVVRDAARGVAHAHAAGILHRDLKPANVLVDKDGRGRVVDFGLARVAGRSALSETGTVAGTPAFMAPEQLDGRRTVGPAADVYALGVTLYAALTGATPFDDADTALELAVRIAEEPAPSPSARGAGISSDLDAVCLACLAKDPRDRYATADELADDLERVLAGEPPRAAQAWALRRLARRYHAAIVASLVVVAVGMAAAAIVRQARTRVRQADSHATQAETRATQVADDAARERAAATAAVSEAIRAELARAAAGELSGPRALESAAARIAARSTPASVEALLAPRVAAAADALATVEPALLRETAAIDDAERAAGLAPIPGLDDALTGLVARARPSPAQRAALAAARARLVARAGRLRPESVRTGGLTFRQLLGARQGEAHGALLREVELCCRALELLPPQPAAAAALTRYLAVEADEERAVGAALALCAQGGSDGLETVQAARERFGASGLYSSRLARGLERLGASLTRRPEESEAQHLVRRAQLRLQQGDLAGARADLDQAVERGPREAVAWQNRADARRLQGDLRGAAEDLTRAIELDPRLGRSWSNRAVVRLLLGDAAGAAEDVQRALELDPALSQAWSARGLIAARAGRLDEALDAFERAATLRPEAAHFVNVGTTLAKLGRLQDALAAFDAALDADPDLADALARRGAVRFNLGDVPGAREDLEHALELEPTHALARANLDALRGDAPTSSPVAGGAPLPNDAAAWSNRAIDLVGQSDLDSALAAVERAVSLDARSAFAWKTRAVVLNTRGDLRGALDAAERAVELDPTDHEAWAGLANLRLEQGDLAGAGEAASRALALAPDDATALVALGRVKQGTGLLDDAEAALAHAVRVAPDRFDARLARADVARARRALDVAARELDAAERLDPTRIEVPIARVGVRFYGGDRAGALALADEVVARWPSDGRAWEARGQYRIEVGDYPRGLADLDEAARHGQDGPQLHYLRGNAHSALGDAATAVADYTHALERSPQNVQALFNRSTARSATDLDGALADAERCVELAPTQARMWTRRGILYGKRGDVAAGLRDLDRALELDATFAEAYFFRALVRRDAGDVAGAIADLRQFLDRAPDHPAAPSARGQLEALLRRR